MLVVLRSRSQARGSTQTWLRPGQRLSVGRTYGDMLVPHDLELSRSHFEIACEANSAWVRDLGSSSGTWLNGVRVERSELRNEDRIKAGTTEFLVNISGVVGETAAAPRSVEPALAAPTPAMDAAKPRSREILNLTPFPAAMLAGRVHHPRHSMTVVVKGTFQLVAGQPAATAEEQLPLEGDIPYSDDEEGLKAPRYSTDFAFFKPRGDLLLVGHCHPPGKQRADKLVTTFAVGQHTRSLLVTGRRYWEGMVTRKPGEARTFAKVPLRYELAFGGKLVPQNPTGKGAVKIEDTVGDVRIPLPQIEDLDELMQRPSDRPPPGGFGPTRWDWEPRRSQLGTYNTAWRKTRWPWFAADLDWGHFNAAPPKMQVEGYLRGDEPLYLKNLHPAQPEWRGALPGLRVRAFFDVADVGLREIPLVLDTVWVDADHGRMTLVWRGVTDVAADDAPEVQRLFVVNEPLADRPTENIEAIYHQALATRMPVSATPPESSPRPPGPTPEEFATRQREKRAEHARLMAELKTRLKETGLDLDNPPPEVKQAMEKVEQQLGLAPSAAKSLWTRERVIEHVAARGSFAGENLAGLNLSELDLSGSDFSKANLSGVRAQKANFSKAMLSGAELTAGDFGEARFEKAKLDKVRAVQARFPQARFHGADLEQAILAGASLTGADLNEVHAPQIDLAAANLRGARLSKAKLAMAQLAAADLSEADLSDADLTQATAPAARLEGALLTGSIWSRADLSRAVLDQAILARASLVEANLEQASLRQAELEQADLSKARLPRADLRQANLMRTLLSSAIGPEAQFAGANLTEARLNEAADFSRCDFRGVVGPRSLWGQTRLQGADFSRAQLDDADFSQVDARAGRFTAAGLRRARFHKAYLERVDFRAANLFQALLVKANLTEADAGEANLYGAGLMEAVLQGFRHERANLGGTLLALR